MKTLYIFGIVLFYFHLAFSLFAQKHNDTGVSKPDNHAPIGVMGDHTHKKGEFMLSYRYMHMAMEGNREGTSSISPEEIVTSIANRFAGMPMQPPTLRVVPTQMNMDMHMFGLMYAPSDWLTLMAMAMVQRSEMKHTTFQGGMGTNQLGNFTTISKGFGDLRLSALIDLLQKGNHKIHFNAGISLPTGSISEEDDILTPMDANPSVRLPYPMQIGSGTFDLLPGITYTGFSNRIAWGGQLLGNIPLGENNEGYSLGNKLDISTWTSYRWSNWISSSLRFTYHNTGQIDGIDANIVAPVQTAHPEFQGGQRLDISIGSNLIGTQGFIKNHRLAIEFDLPVYQNLNGPQMEVDYNLSLGWQYAF